MRKRPFILFIFIILIFQFEISGKDLNNERLLNRYFILIRLFVFYFEISGNDDNNEHSKNR